MILLREKYLHDSESLTWLWKGVYYMDGRIDNILLSNHDTLLITLDNGKQHNETTLSLILKTDYNHMDKELKEKYALHIKTISNKDLLNETLIAYTRHDGVKYNQDDIFKRDTCEEELTRRLTTIGFLPK